jgi:hypothetical protein
VNAQTPITADNVSARIAEREAQETANLERLSGALTDLIAARKSGAGKAWAEWHFYKAMSDWAATDDTADWFAEACDELGVDSEGYPIDADGLPLRDADYGAAHPDNPSYARICAGGVS